MKKKIASRQLKRDIEVNALYQRAQDNWRAGRLTRAFRFFLASAKAGMVPAFAIVGQFYDFGEGVRSDSGQALRWYERAYRHGNRSVANNIGCIWRDKGNPRVALVWFKRAVEFGDGDANLNIARIYLRNRGTKRRAIQYLERVHKSKQCTEGSKEEASALLDQLAR